MRSTEPSIKAPKISPKKGALTVALHSFSLDVLCETVGGLVPGRTKPFPGFMQRSPGLGTKVDGKRSLLVTMLYIRI